MANDAAELSRAFHKTVAGKLVGKRLRPFVIERVEEPEGEVIDIFKDFIFYGKIHTKDGWKSAHFEGKSLRLTPTFIGAIDYGKGVLYVERSSVKQYRWGLNLNNKGIDFTFYDGSGKHDLTDIVQCLDTSLSKSVLLSILNPKFFRYRTALKKVQSTYYSVAISKNCWLSKADGKVLIVYRKCVIGEVLKEKAVLLPNANCFKEELKGYGIPVE